MHGKSDELIFHFMIWIKTQPPLILRLINKQEEPRSQIDCIAQYIKVTNTIGSITKHEV